MKSASIGLPARRLRSIVVGLGQVVPLQGKAPTGTKQLARSGSQMATVAAHAELIADFKQVIPSLTGSNYKGQHGKIGIIGGCREYTGAPYFAAISATKVGADLTYVFCTESAATVIKGYSPELIVLPLLPEASIYAAWSEWEEEAAWPDLIRRSSILIDLWVKRLSCLVVGPGLGDDHLANTTARSIIMACREANIPLIVDGSGINIITEETDLVKGYQKCLLTPNVAELGRLATAVNVPLEGNIGSHWQKHAQDIAIAWGGPVIVSKGPADIITDGKTTLTCDVAATPKRSGGQGDVLAGVVAAFVSWSQAANAAGGNVDLMTAAYAASTLVRTASLKAYGEHGRAMVAGNIIQELRGTFKQLLE